MTFKCKFCDKSFRLEKTLSSHMCPKKKRWSEQDTIGARLGFSVFLRFYELTMPTSKKQKTIEEFIDSPYYLDFVKFGRHLVDLDPINTNEFVDFVIENGVKLKEWTRDYVYDSYLAEINKKETPQRAVERTIILMEQWAEENGDEIQNFFKNINTNRATFLIRSGKISPWVLYLCKTADYLFERLNPEQAKIISEAINPSVWEARFRIKKDDVEFITTLLQESGL